ncbi:MAG: glycosyltransferase family 9 protein, partial [Elusimicrobiota bacterium]
TEEEKNAVVINPGAGLPSRRWPVERFIEIIDYLIKKKCYNIILSGSINEKIIGDIIAKEFPGKINNLSGKTSLMKIAGIISKSKLLITNDTGILHIGAALNAPMIAIMGPGDFIRYDPGVISANARVLYNGMNCSPCEKYDCKDLKCLKSISVEEVKKAIDEFIN